MSNNQPLIEYGSKPWYLKLLPFENLTYHSIYNIEEIIYRLQSRTEKEKWIRLKGIFSSKTLDFEGKVERNSFNISRISSRPSWYQAQALGTMRSDFNHTTIEVQIRPRIMGGIMLILGIIYFVFVIGSRNYYEADSIILLIAPVIMIIIFIVFLRYQTNRTKRLFKEIFGTDPNK